MGVLVELALLADPMTFPYPLAARPVAEGLELRGYVPTETVRQRALQVAQKAAPVPVVDGLKIQSNLLVALPTAAPANLAEEVREQLVRVNPERGAVVSVKLGPNGQVVLSGQVATLDEKLRMSRSLRGVPGCLSVKNDLAVGIAAAPAPKTVALAPAAPAAPAPAPIVELQPVIRISPTPPSPPPEESKPPTPVVSKPPVPVVSPPPALVEVKPPAPRTPDPLPPSHKPTMPVIITPPADAVKPAVTQAAQPPASSAAKPVVLTPALRPPPLPVHSSVVPLGKPAVPATDKPAEKPALTKALPAEPTPPAPVIRTRPTEPVGTSILPPAPPVPPMPPLPADTGEGVPATIIFDEELPPAAKPQPARSAVTLPPATGRSEEVLTARRPLGRPQMQPAGRPVMTPNHETSTILKQRIATVLGPAARDVDLDFDGHGGLTVKVRRSAGADHQRLTTQILQVPELAGYHPLRVEFSAE
jgi:hypothetical protein